MENSNDTIGNQTCDLPTCSTVPQPTVPPHIPITPLSNDSRTLTSGNVHIRGCMCVCVCVRVCVRVSVRVRARVVCVFALKGKELASLLWH